MTNYGGHREGSGRKKKETVAITLRIPKDILEALNKKYQTSSIRNKEIIEVIKILVK